MTEENIAGGLSEAEQAYFDSEGETSFEEAGNEAETKTEAETGEAGVLDEKDGEAQAEIEGKGERDEKGRFVNYGALHAERTKRQQLEQEVGGLKQFKAAMEEKMRWTEALLTPEQKVEEDPMPDPNVDIFAHSQWQARQLEKLNAKITERETTEKQAKDHEARENAVWGLWDQSVASIKAEKADFGDAATFLSDMRTKQLSALGNVHAAFKDPRAVNQQINNELRDIIINAAQNNISPAQAVYDLATAWGYAAKAADPAAITMPEKLKGIEQAQQGSRTVGQASGARSGGDEITIESLAAMPQNEFNEWMKVPANEKRFKSLMGG